MDLFQNPKIDSNWSKEYILGIYFLGGHVKALLGPCWDHNEPSSTLRPARSMKFSRLTQHGPSNLSIEYPVHGSMTEPYLDQVRVMVGLVAVPG